jgi:hypothetical protein
MLRTACCLPLLLVLASSCAHYQDVPVPPQVDLTRYPAVGLIRFASNSGRAYDAYATQKFLQHVTQAQQVRIIDLGTVEQALAGVGMPQFDAAAMRAIGAKYGVQAVFNGTVEFTGASPSVSLSSFGSLGVHAEVQGTLTATLYETQAGAILWTDTSADRASAGGITLDPGSVGVDVSNVDNAYTRMIGRMSFHVTDSFRTHLVRQRVDG